MNIVVELITQAYTEDYRVFTSRITDEKVYEIYWHAYMK